MRKEMSLLSVLSVVVGCAANEPADVASVAAMDDARSCPEMQPVAAFPPQYPREALMAGEGGSVEIRFDVAADGSTTNHAVVTATDGRTFNAAAIEAISKWRFPASDSGCRGATYTISFEVDQGSDRPPKTQ